ncbi:hypothetical protein P4N68_00295 [Corynebacterium felinum]|uniref:Nitroreductase domain-containing protein n=1 Tax=Corynebacterium felinum TaxID=131318 RepID=A0ABU2BBT2_9CORY|nr:hypothetical protein [Corynebacterium felinum]MDF5819523.1 hypothetical protein [Corynebacterium felinum]MDR7356094.1 hypothetical protein [Corynebacterium felinum]WJY95428.1 hypothetical protein CFELI_09120 [Corynebacterium felinum]
MLRLHLESCDSPSARAPIALSATLRAGLVINEAPLSYDQISAMGLSLRQVWNRAADSMIAAELESPGVAVRTRPSRVLTGVDSPGLQVAFRHSPAPAWLAHPRTFSVLHYHLCDLAGMDVCYFAPTSLVLFAVGTHSVHRLMQCWSQPVELVGSAVYFAQGFPSEKPPCAVAEKPAVEKVSMQEFLRCS